jgi:hypothetical protein
MNIELKKEIRDKLNLMANTLLYSKTDLDLKPSLIVDEFTEYFWTWFESKIDGVREEVAGGVKSLERDIVPVDLSDMDTIKLIAREEGYQQALDDVLDYLKSKSGGKE